MDYRLKKILIQIFDFLFILPYLILLFLSSIFLLFNVVVLSILSLGTYIKDKIHTFV